jgi:hypothetical protein
MLIRSIVFAIFSCLLLVVPAAVKENTSASIEITPPVDSLASTSVYYTIRPDKRRCASPMCGGYFIKRVNQNLTPCANGKSQPECYVATIEWNGQPEVNPQQALLRGSLISRGDKRGKYGVLKVTESWKAAGSGTSTPGDFFRVRDRGIRCVAPPCPTHHEARLNDTRSRDIAGVDLSTAQADEKATAQAFEAMTGQEGVLLSGTHSPVSGPAGRSQSLKADQFYLRETGTAASHPCMRTGCSSQICADKEVVTACDYRPEYECYKKAACERQKNGECGFTMTPELAACLKNAK